MKLRYRTFSGHRRKEVKREMDEDEPYCTECEESLGECFCDEEYEDEELGMYL